MTRPRSYGQALARLTIQRFVADIRIRLLNGDGFERGQGDYDAFEGTGPALAELEPLQDDEVEQR